MLSVIYLPRIIAHASLQSSSAYWVFKSEMAQKMKKILMSVVISMLVVVLMIATILHSLHERGSVELLNHRRSNHVIIPAAITLGNQGAREVTTASIVPSINATSYINPGCIKHSLNAYRPVQTSLIYHHPSIVHYIKLSQNDRDTSLHFREYLSMMSAYKLLKPERILVHSNANINGERWNQVQEWVGTTVEVNHVKRVTQLNGKHVSWIQIAADYIKVSQLLEHGGLVMDFDVIIINGTRLKEEQRRSECVLAQEGDIPNAGFMSCIKNSSFVRQWLSAYHNDYQPSSWLYNSAFVPNNILLGKTSPICYNVYLDDTICVHPNAKQAPKQWLSSGGVPHWRRKTAAHYYLNRVSLPSDDQLLKGDTSFSEMLRYIYEYKPMFN